MRGLVTRAVVGTEATVKVIDLATDAISTVQVVIDKRFAEDEKAKVRKAVVKQFADREDVAVVTVVDFKQVNKLYGVKQEIFMANAIELDPETRKPLETKTDAE